MPRRAPLLFTLLFLCACDGNIGDVGVGPDTPDGPPRPEDLIAGTIEGGGFQRLSVRELELTLDSLFPTITGEREHFPEESFGFFDTDRDDARIGTAFMDSALAVAESVVEASMADEALRAELLNCDESATAICVENFVDRWPMRMIQRELDMDERAAFVALAGAELGTTEDVVGVALTALLVHPEFLYKVTVGTGDADKRPLVQREVLSRLSVFLWGHAPDDALRARVEGSDLRLPAERAALAEWMMDDGRAAAQRSAFHAQWLGYSQLSREGLAGDMWLESDALVERATAEGADYRLLFLSPETFLTFDLAAHYGLPTPENASGEWTPYGAAPRSGVLAHASFLSSYRAQGEGSPTKRGKAVLNRLLCRSIELPNDMDVNTDDGPEPDQCRKDFLENVHSAGSCASCHAVLDGIGFGLDIFDGSGVQIETEPDKPHCGLEGAGQFAGARFTGADGLAEAIVSAPEHASCMVQQLLHFQVGTDPSQSSNGLGTVRELTDQYIESGYSYRALVLAIVRSESFAEVNLP